MRILFSATPAYGHVLPLAPLMQAAVAAGHAVALTTSAGVRDQVGPELAAEVEWLAAGAMPMEFSQDAARRTGADPFHPSPELIGEIFGRFARGPRRRRDARARPHVGSRPGRVRSLRRHRPDGRR
ncbi:hypothetical protein [Saccharopolyspora mangrovi]|uniref:Glycosyltransferase n=1 Tax=Saccharopolyspora mangrovi TaxID=3082379 RepID=A0ABU6AHB9_9PSEU|nr:hypothetical protein [Saccharopolyspora sp. S2-29]MEB3370843.1 hypothetical protein [Saccharopolyspora sp. S2-29]